MEDEEEKDKSNRRKKKRKKDQADKNPVMHHARCKHDLRHSANPSPREINKCGNNKNAMKNNGRVNMMENDGSRCL